MHEKEMGMYSKHGSLGSAQSWRTGDSRPGAEGSNATRA